MRVRRRQFNAGWAKLCHARGRYEGPGATRAAYWTGCDTRWAVMRQLQACADVKGRVFLTSKPQRCTELEKGGRNRHIRTMRRVLIDLQEMGLVKVTHVRRSGAARRPGELDCLSVRILGQADVTPPYGQPGQGGEALQASPPACPGAATSTTTTELPPPSAADGEGPPYGGPPSVTEDEEPMSRLRFLRMKRDLGWIRPDDERELKRLEARYRRAMTGPASTPDDKQGSDARCNEP